MLSRREFLKIGSLASAGLLAGCEFSKKSSTMLSPTLVPSYLKDYDAVYQVDPRQAAKKWFAQARFGLFMHYGLYSQLGRGEWVMFHEKISVTEYKKLQYAPIVFPGPLIEAL